VLGWLAAPLRGLWSIARGSRIDVGGGLRPGSGASALYLFFFLVLCLIGGLLVGLGLDLQRVDAWLDSHKTWFELAGAIAFKAVLALVLFVSAVISGAGLWSHIGAIARWTTRQAAGREAPRHAEVGSRSEASPFGWSAIIVALIVGYFAAVGLFT
jgi:hypothetical protein